MRLGGRLERAHLARLPHRARLEDYHAASAEIVAHLETIPGLVAIYQTGSVSAPGISDLDLIAVVEADRRIPDLWSSLSPRTRYLAMHAPMVVDVERFVCHRAFAHADPLVHVTGDRLAVEPRPVPEYSEPLIAAEGLVNTVLRLAKQAATLRVKVRPSLCEVNSLKFDLELGGIDRTSAPEAWELVDRIHHLRGSWFDGPPDRVQPILGAALDVSLRALSQLDAVAGERLRSDRTPPARPLTGPWKNVTVIPGPTPGLAMGRGAASSAISLRGRSGDGSELAWRLLRARLAVPPAIAAALHGDALPAYSEFRRERDRTVAAYQGFMVRNASGYSMMGLAGLFQ
jgi:hypothetical protein